MHMARSNIEWTDYVWNFLSGCSKVSAGCQGKNCYAETIANRFWKERKFTDVQIDESKLELPLHLKKPRMIFVNSMSDLFHEKISFEVIAKCWDTMFDTERHTYQILTKRPERMLDFIKWMNEKQNRGTDYNNVWLGVSVENQQTADERIPLLLQTPAAVKFLSIEPLLEPIAFEALTGIDWVIIGCESGHKRRNCELVWIEHIIKQCRTNCYYIPIFIKQLSIDGKVVRNISRFPKHLQIREYPK